VPPAAAVACSLTGDHPLSRSAVDGLIPQGVRVLVADDDALIRRAISQALTRLGFEIMVADDGATAIAMAEHTRPDLAVVDLTMPTSGFEVLDWLKTRHGPAVHVAILSATQDDAIRMSLFDAGADDVMVKPMSAGELQRKVVASARTQQAYIEVRQAREHADRLLAWSAEASALLAHDLNNGLAVALSNMTYLAHVLEVSDDERDALTATLRALRRMSGLVANFVDIGRFEDDTLRPRCAPVPLRQALLEVVALHAPSVGRGIRHTVVCEADLTGCFDEALILRVVHNLVGNAGRYCNPGGLIRLAAVPVVDGGRTWVEVSVHNTGPQIPAGLQAKLFHKYALGKEGQRGLGLYFCRLAVEAHGGSVRLDSHPDGPCFVLRLPAAPATPAG